MALKLSFRFERQEYSMETRASGNMNIRTTLAQTLDGKEIIVSRIFAPSRNSVKAIFPSETELNKVLEDEDLFIQKGLTPKITMKLRAVRTIFCAGFDTTLFNTYSKEDIKGQLLDLGWSVRGVFILSNNRAMKIEFNTRKQAQNFLTEDTLISGGFK